MNFIHHISTTAIALGVAAGMLFSATEAKALELTDYVGFAVKDTTLYGFSNLQTATIISSSILSSSSANHLATDADRNRLLYTASSATNNVYAWNMTTNSRELLGTITDFGHSITNSSGGASFWNNAYYLYADQASGGGILKVTFNLDGTIAAVTKPFGNGHPDGGFGLGDIAISATGIMYILQTDGDLYSLDLTVEGTPSPNFQTVKLAALTSGGGQLFFDQNGELLTRTQGGANTWSILSPSTGNITGTINAGTTLSDYADLSSAPVIPEPSTYLLLGMSAAGWAFYRARQARKAA